MNDCKQVCMEFDFMINYSKGDQESICRFPLLSTDCHFHIAVCTRTVESASGFSPGTCDLVIESFHLQSREDESRQLANLVSGHICSTMLSLIGK